MDHSFQPSRRGLIGLGLGAIGAGVVGGSATSALAAEPLELTPVGGAQSTESAPMSTEAVAPTASGIQYISFAGIDFQSISDSQVYDSSSGQLLTTTGAYVVNVQLPQGATVTEVVWYLVKSGSGSPLLRFVREQAHTVGGNFTEVTNSNAAVLPVSTAMQAVIAVPAATEVVDNASNSYFVIFNGAANHTMWGVRIGFRPATTITTSFVPLTPGRVYDSRWAVFGNAKIANGENRTISVASRRRINPDDGAVDLADFVPTGARAVAYNVTVTETVNAGFLAAAPGDAAAYTASTINWSETGQNLANGTVVMLDASRNMKIFAGGLTHFIVDVVGYYI